MPITCVNHVVMGVLGEEVIISIRSMLVNSSLNLGSIVARNATRLHYFTCILYFRII
jgi:hypothetical protein